MSHDDLPKIESTPQGPSVFSSGASIDIDWDNRDSVSSPCRSQYASFHYTHYAPGLGNDTRFDEFRLRYSHYRALSERSVLAWEANSAFTQRNILWNMMPLLGSDERMHGYYQGRYRGKNVINNQLECRRQLTRRHGIVAWIEAGTMGPSLLSLNGGRWLPTGGVGYRFELKPQVNIRLDYGIGKDSSGFYFQVRETF